MIEDFQTVRVFDVFENIVIDVMNVVFNVILCVESRTVIVGIMTVVSIALCYLSVCYLTVH